MLRKILLAGGLAALFAGPSFAQPASPSPSQSNIGIPLNPQRVLTPEEIERQKASDRAYNEAIQKIPDKKPSADPWGNVRPGSATTTKNKQQ
jgi:hypothetical protein